MFQNKVNCFFVIIIVLLSGNCFALPEDKNEVINLRADSADLNQQTHNGKYIGNVEFDQGSSHLRAAEAITKANEKNELIKAIAKGSKKEQAHYWALTAPDKPPLHAYADKITYFPERHIIELIGNARVEQGTDSFSAPKIIYDTEHEHVVTESDGKKRTVIIFHPEKKA
ncbi:lipopolysaccharide export system protein LptA (plasmid) [Legionella adelaidensis]|uniref:Lipopolysaccharide export system protein LptA n=1 Tax=Legionella adelaidensis TaxID=45056 RepID=A0A0W0R3Y1_9GAMM|nr:lipopolysaccharide transport periplasmic protein LptA [Legionella adelaidensis]KTC65726.1 lipopolysaccharide export system protein LptA [Legionella adelaidensis]VEH85108.1 lipopolysaccharide export system protein LptA [Legionella adelaidensis]